jgi:hypothetical protein
VRGESCGDCGSYLKILSLDKDQQAEAVADDLASLALDAALENRALPAADSIPCYFPAALPDSCNRPMRPVFLPARLDIHRAGPGNGAGLRFAFNPASN